MPHNHLTKILAALALGSGSMVCGQAQDLAAASTGDRPPTVEQFEEPAPQKPGGQNGTGFRFTYPVRDTNSDRVYTEANPPVQESTEQIPQPDADSGMTDSFATETPAPPLDAFPDGENLPEPANDIGEGVFSKSPFRYSFAVYEGYNSNVNGRSSGGVESLYTQVEAGVSYSFGTSRLQMELGLSAGVQFYYNNEGLQNDGIFPNGTFTLSANYAATPRLDFSLANTTALLSQPSFGTSGGASSYQGSYLYNLTQLGAKYLWLPKFATETTYTPMLYYYFESEGSDFSYLDQTFSQQFLYLWKPTTALVAEYRFNIRNYFDLTDYNSLGNYLLLGFDHTLNPRSTLTFRGGAEQRLSQNPVTGGTYNSVRPFGELNFIYAVGPRTSLALTSRYGSTGTSVNNYSENQQFLLGMRASHRFGRRLTFGAFANYQNNYYSQPGGRVNGVNRTPSFNYNVINAGVEAGYYIRPDIWSLQAGYSYTTQLSSNESYQGDYTQSVVFIGTRFDF